MLFEREELQFLEICPCNIKHRGQLSCVWVYLKKLSILYILLNVYRFLDKFTHEGFLGAVIIGKEKKNHIMVLYIYLLQNCEGHFVL